MVRKSITVCKSKSVVYKEGGIFILELEKIKNNNNREILEDYFLNELPIKEICSKHNIGDRYLYRLLKENNLEKRKTKGQKLLEKIKDNKELFYYLLGLISSDGYVYKEKPRVEINLKLSDCKILEGISQYLYGENKVIYEPNFSVNGRSRLFLYGKEIVLELYKYGITQKKSSTLSLNIEMFEKEYVGHFYRGYIDGDGSIVYKNNNNINIRIVGNLDTTTKFKEMTKRFFNIESSVFKVNSDASFDIYRWQVCKNEDVLKILNNIYKNAHFYLDRKFDKIKTVIKT